MGFSAVFSQNILIRWLTGRGGTHDLSVTMSGIRLGERLLQVGLADGRLLVALAAKIGMSGRSCGVDEQAAAVSRAEASRRRGPRRAPPADRPSSCRTTPVTSTWSS